MGARFCTVSTVKSGPSFNSLAEGSNAVQRGSSTQELVDGPLNSRCKKDLSRSLSSTVELLVLHANVRDLRVLGRLPQLTRLISENGRRYEVLVISETWFRSLSEAAAFNIEGFIQINSFRVSRNGGGSRSSFGNTGILDTLLPDRPVRRMYKPLRLCSRETVHI